MGGSHSLEDDLITFKLTSKQFARSAKKCDKNMETQKQKLKKAMEQGNMEGARIYAQNVIREKNQSLNFLRLGSRIDAVASRLETAIRMQQINSAMSQTVKGMSNAMKSMKVEQIASTMEEFEKNFEDMDVRSGYMESTMESTTSMTTPPEEVDTLMKMVADEAGLELAGQLDVQPTGAVATPAAAQKDPASELEARLAALRG
ncbi:Snf7-domain-containing protein [Ochromonadaceae sp. CCMP2298]|nr:Snf7-domain-containing protein [Ochromonadaceae sp. CCMP2298]|mmetsp:Transcript_17655/g.38453  ORF Transcript_17655/g.38453 Transcript_17655/m.38453 type:complete len:203 (+) Transcript_17655:136-744(+)